MKCDNKLTFKIVKKKQVIDQAYNWAHKNPPKDAEVCGGDISVDLIVVDAPLFQFDTLEVNWKCSRCHNRAVFLGLPYDKDGLAEFVGMMVGGLKKNGLEKLRKKIEKQTKIDNEKWAKEKDGKEDEESSSKEKEEV